MNRKLIVLLSFFYSTLLFPRDTGMTCNLIYDVGVIGKTSDVRIKKSNKNCVKWWRSYKRIAFVEENCDPVILPTLIDLAKTALLYKKKFCWEWDGSFFYLKGK